MQSIDEMLDPGEKIIWRGKPELLPFVFNEGTLALMIFGLFFAGISLPITIIGIITIIMSLMGLVFMALGMIIALAPLWQYFSFQKTEYAFTNRRVFIKSGLWSNNFKVIDYHDIKNFQISIGIFDKLFKLETGTISIDCGQIAYTKNGTRLIYSKFQSIKNPYNVFKELKRVSLDIQTDIEYPNKMRPSENPGYQTEYQPKEK